MQVGFKALEASYALRLAQPLRVVSTIGTTRFSKRSPEHDHDQNQNQYTPGYKPEDSFAGHFGFGLKYEEVHLEFFARLFAATGPEPIAAWCRYEPTGKYARRAGFFYEWLTGEHLDVPDLTNGAYIPAVDPKAYLARTQPLRDKRWRVDNNLPGNRDFCPLVRRTAVLQDALMLDPAVALAALDREFGEDVLMRAAAWLTLKESRASFLIENEADKADRIRRFANVIGEHCGKIADPLSDASLQMLQGGILGDSVMRVGLRRSPVFVGQSSIHGDIVHYIAPHFEDVARMRDGLIEFERATRGQEALVRAAAIAFGFVYLHPMSDGNGRIHRFLINDTLQRDGAVPDGVILPVSASITNNREFGRGYERALESFSRPFMHRYADAYRFGALITFSDGVNSNLIFDEYPDANCAWRYPDLTEHATYTARLVAHTIHTEMAEEARVLLKFQLALRRLKDVMEMPDTDAGRIIRSLKDNCWQVSGKLQREYPQLKNKLLALRMVEAVQSAFEGREPAPIID